MGSTFFGPIKITLFAHASLLLSFEQINFYIDPYVIPKNAPVADAIFFTHEHFDHLSLPKNIVGPNTKVFAKGGKIPSIQLEIGQKFKVSDVLVEVVHAYNVNKPFHPKGFGAGFIFSFPTSPKPTRVYVAGDTDLIEEMKNYSADVAIVPIGGTYTMNAEQAAKAISILKPKLAIPYHYNYLQETAADPKEFERLVKFFIPQTEVKILF
ncbi:MAG: MBL fold metallo-hydrolase [Candidatus Micrarchaeota archaeon]|nr:MBL fold metallo-hydrolase [Candidatus Micrarchaeota archaeon]